MPTFTGSRVNSQKCEFEHDHPDFLLSGSCDSSIMWQKLTHVPHKLHNPTLDEQDPLAHLFADLPTPSDDVEVSFLFGPLTSMDSIALD